MKKQTHDSSSNHAKTKARKALSKGGGEDKRPQGELVEGDHEDEHHLVLDVREPLGDPLGAGPDARERVQRLGGQELGGGGGVDPPVVVHVRGVHGAQRPHADVLVRHHVPQVERDHPEPVRQRHRQPRAPQSPL